MRCQCCKKKGIPIDCKYCTKHFCSRCINLEEHKCEGLQSWKDDYKKRLEKQLEFKPSTTLPSF